MNRINTFVKPNRTKKGFTLVELIVVLVIIAVLAAISIPAFLHFIDYSKEKEVETNARKCLTQTQATLNDIYSDSRNSFSPTMRKRVKELVGVGDSEFIVWTQKQLVDGSTKALPENYSSYLIDKALYQENGIYVAYANGKWSVVEASSWEDAKIKVSADDKLAIHMWPYKWDSAYLDNPSGEDNPDYLDPDDENSIKVAVLNIDPEIMDRVYFTREGRDTNSGYESLRILFWKEGDEDKSTWSNKSGRDLFEAEDGYYYEFRYDSQRYNVHGWIPQDLSMNPTFDILSIRNYVYKHKEEGNVFVFNLSFDDLGGLSEVPYICINRQFFINSLQGNAVNGVTQKAVDEYNKKTVPADAVRIDDGSVEDGYAFAWREGSDYVWWTNAAKAIMPSDCSYLFSGKNNVNNFNFSGFYFNETITMEGMFEGCRNLKSVSNLGVGDEGKLQNTTNMFKDCLSLENPGTDALSSSELISIKGMFENCSAIQSITFSEGFNTSKVTDYEKLFYGCKSVSQVEVSSLDTSSAETFKSMFEGCESLNDIDVSSWDTSHVQDMSSMFKNCKSLNSVNTDGWNLEKVKTLQSAFEGMTSLNEITISEWKLSECSEMSDTFKGCISLNALNTGNIKTTRKLTKMNGTFSGCYSLSSIELNAFVTSSVTDMSNLFSMNDYFGSSDFKNNYKLQTISFGPSFDTSKVGSMSRMFDHCIGLKNIEGLSDFKTDRLTDVSYMFAYTESLEEIDLSSFDTRKVVSYEGMFFFEKDKTSLVSVWASPRFKIEDDIKNSYLMFNNDDLLVGQRNTKFSSNRDEQIENYNTAEFASIDGWDGEQGYFKAKLKVVYVHKANFQNLFNEEIDGIQKIDSDEYTASTIQYVEGVKSIKDTSSGKNTEFYIYAWKDGNVIKWWTDADIAYLPDDCTSLLSDKKMKSFDFTGFAAENLKSTKNMFARAANLETVCFGNMFYADNLANADNMFDGCKKLSSADMSNFHAPYGQLTSMAYMFRQCSELSEITFAPDYNTSNVTSFYETFYGCTSVTNLDVSGFKMEKATTLFRTFSGMSSLETLIIGDNWDLRNCQTLEAAFENCPKLESADEFSKIKTSDKLTNLRWVFNGNKGFTNVDISSWNVSNVTSLQNAFSNCTNLESVKINGADMNKISGTRDCLKETFTGCMGGEGKVLSICLEGWTFKNPTDVGWCIYSCNADSIDYSIEGSHFNNLTSLAEMLSRDKNNATRRIIRFNMSSVTGIESVTDIQKMFYYCQKLESVDFGEWDASEVTNMNCTFEGCNFKELDLSNLSISKVNNLNYTFKKCTSLESINLSGWDTSNLKEMKECFREDSNLKTINLKGWNLGSVTVIDNAFMSCQNLETVYVSSDYALNDSVNQKSVFSNDTKLTGQNGTSYSSNLPNRNNAIYAWPDGKDGRAGYFSLID